MILAACPKQMKNVSSSAIQNKVVSELSPWVICPFAQEEEAIGTFVSAFNETDLELTDSTLVPPPLK